MVNKIIPLSFGRSAQRALRVFLTLALIVSQLALTLPGAIPASAAGGSYSLDWVAADPEIGNGPAPATYPRVQPGQQACPTPGGGSGRAADPLPNAIYGDPRDAVQTLAPDDLALGQIVPFEVR